MNVSRRCSTLPTSLFVVEARAGVVQSETRHTLAGPSPARRVQDLADLDVDTLVCGAISRDVESMVAAHGIRVMAFLAGDLAEIVAAWAAGRLSSARYAMPGCCGRGRGRGAGGGRHRGRTRTDS